MNVYDVAPSAPGGYRGRRSVFIFCGRNTQDSWLVRKPEKTFWMFHNCRLSRQAMDNRNPVFEALAKPQFETIQVGSVFYREIRIPHTVREFTDTSKWDQTSTAVAKGEIVMGEIWERKSERNACVFSDPSSSSEEKSGHEGGNEKETCGFKEEGNSAVPCDTDRRERKDVLCTQPDVRGGGGLQQLETAGSSFWTEEGPYLDDSTGQWVLKLQMWWPLRTFFVRGKGALITKVSKQHQVLIRLHSHRPRFVLDLRAPDSTPLLRAREFIGIFLENNVDSLSYTHFISLPLTDPRFHDRFNIFKTQVLAAYPGFDEALFAKPEGLHITLLLLRVVTEEQEARCREVLDTLSREVYDAVDTRSLVLHLKGLHLMNDDPSEASVIYTAQYTGNEKDRETSRRLRRLRLVITEAFRAAGLISEKEIIRQQSNELRKGDEQELHATLLNAKFRRNALAEGVRATNQATQAVGGTKLQRPGGGTFDSTQLLSEFTLFDFFEIRVPSVDLVARAFYYPVNKHVVETSVRLP